ncbi:MAG: hypothetical protein ABFE01_07120 [Phycisphaerales bacterium]|jgi:hypothetical protein
MKLFRVNDLRALAEQRQWPCISLYVPTHRAGKDTKENPIRLRNAIGGAKDRLAQAGYPKDRIAGLLEPLDDMIVSRDFWLHQSDGLAMFVAPNFFQFYRVPLKLHDDVVVTDHFAVRQLIPLFTEDGRFFVLAMSQKRIRFFEATRTGIQERAVPDMLQSIEDLRQYTVTEEYLQGHTSAPTTGTGGAGAVMTLHSSGTIADKAQYKADVQQYIHAIARKLDKHLADETSPLIVAAVEYEQAFFRQETTYRHLLKEGIEGNPDGYSDDQIHDAAWKIAEPNFAQAKRDSLKHFADLLGTGKTSDRIEQILPAAVHGRVRALYLRTDVPVWGRFDPKTSAVAVHSPAEEGDRDLLCLATINVLQNRGMAYALNKEEMPTKNPHAAMFRY